MKTKYFRLLLAATAVMSLVLLPGCNKNDQKDENAGPFYGSLTDIEGNFYKTVEIGWGEWMTENFRATKYNDGTPIPTGLDPAEWSNTLEGAYAVYPHEDVDGLDSDEEVVNAYGLHYNWYAVETGKLCPPGWRVPSAEDWHGLLSYLIDNYDEINAENAGDFLKSCRQVDSPLGDDCNTNIHPRWNKDGVDHFKEELLRIRLPEGEYPRPGFEFNFVFEPGPLAGTDEFGFAALPAGQYSGMGFGMGYICNYWTTDGDTRYMFICPETKEIIGIELSHDAPGMDEYIMIELDTGYAQNMNSIFPSMTMISKTTGFPVRCVRGDLPEGGPVFRFP